MTFTPRVANSLATSSPIPLDPPVIRTTSWLLTNLEWPFQLLSAQSDSLALIRPRMLSPRKNFRVRTKAVDVM